MSLEIENEFIRVNNQLCEFSADGRFFAVAYQTNLIVKDAKNFDTFQSFVFTELIEYFEWSRDSEYILCANIKKAIVQVYSIHYTQWKCKLIEGSAGLESVTWSPDSRHILTLSDFNIQVTVWSLEKRSASHIQNLKSSSFIKLNFSPNGSRLSVIIADEGQDSVEIYKTDTWKLSRKLICERLSNIDGTCWSPNSELLCIWCSFTGEPKLIIYSTVSEKNIATFCPTKKHDTSEAISNYGRELRGIENVAWISSGQLLAVTGFNETIVLLHHVTWKPIMQLYLDPVIRENNYLNKVYQERTIEPKSSHRSTISDKRHILEEQPERPINIRIGKKDDNYRLQIAKTDILKFSFCGQYLAIKHQLYPSTLWIWNVIDDYLDYLILENTIVAVKWNPTRAHLLVFCEDTHIFEWMPQSANCIPTPRNIMVMDGRWHPRGNVVALCGFGNYKHLQENEDLETTNDLQENEKKRINYC